MKRVIPFVLCLLLALSACGNGGSGEKKMEQTEKEGTTAEQAQTEKTPSDTGSVGDFTVAIKGSKLAKSYDGEDTIVITYDFTNDYTEAQMADVVLHCTAYQDGVQLDGVYTLSDGTDVTANAMKKIKPGTTLECTAAYALPNLTSDVTFEVEEFLGMTGETLSKTFSTAQ